MRIKDILENPESIFYLLTREEKEEFERFISLTNYRKNKIVFREGDYPNGLLMLVNGNVKICKEGISGREQIIRIAGPLDMIGYRALFAGENHIASAITFEPSLICTVSHEFIFNRALKNIRFCHKLVKILTSELGFSNARTVSLAQKHIRGRLAESLIILKNKFGFEKDGLTLNVYLSREDIANLSNMTTSNAIRTLSTLASERIISIDGRIIKILDLPKLERVSKLG